MAKSTSNTSSLSGLGVAFGFIPAGILLGYWLTEAYGSATKYIAALLILIGLTGFFIELSNRFAKGSLRFDNLGIALFLLLPSLYGMYLVYEHTEGWWRGSLITVLGFLVLIGFMAVGDFIVSIFEALVKVKDRKGMLVGLLKFIAIIASSLATIFAAAQQLVQ